MNNYKTLALALCLMASGGVMAQNSAGGISPEMLTQIEKAQGSAKVNKALFNAIASNKIDDLAKNFANLGPIDNHFSVETPKQSIHDQKSSGRCWMFSGLNVLRSNFAKEHADHLRIDTHRDNLPMQGASIKAGFERAGIVYVSDGTPRVAFDWLREA